MCLGQGGMVVGFVLDQSGYLLLSYMPTPIGALWS